MANIKEEFGTSTSITITLNSLATSATAGRASAAIDFTTDKFIDVLFTVTVKILTGTIANDKGCHVWLYLSEDGTNYADALSAGDAAYTPNSPNNAVYLGFIEMPTQSATYRKIFSLRDRFSSVPRKAVLVVRNYCGINLDSTGNSATYTGIYYTSV